MARKRVVTTTDIAERAGVSRAAVSVVLNGARSNVRVAASKPLRMSWATRRTGRRRRFGASGAE